MSDLPAIEKMLIEMVSKAMGIPATEINIDHSFPELGMDSLASMFLLDDLEQKLKIEINPLLIWERPTIRLFAEAIHQLEQSTPLRS